MAITVLTALIVSFTAIYIFYYRTSQEITAGSVRKKTCGFILLAAFAVRLLLAALYPGHGTDMNCFDSWSDMVFSEGFKSFYTSDAFTDYPPGYMYILYLIGFVKNALNCNQALSYILLKLPAIICDVLSGLLVYRLCRKNSRPELSGMFAVFFLFNPAVILNSSLWGQVDSVFTLFVLIMLYCLTEKRMIASYFTFAAAVFIKPQALFYTPVLIYGIIDNVFLNDFSRKKFTKNLLAGLSAIASIFILAVPFGIGNVIEQYQSTIGSYSYASVNAYNLWTALGMNWTELNPLISAVGYLSICIIVVFSAAIFFSKKQKNKYFYTSAFICFSTFMLSVKMHERYAFPAMTMLLCACCISLKREEFLLYIGISAVQLLNTAHVLFYYNNDTFYTSSFTAISLVISWVSILFLAYFWVYSKRTYCRKPIHCSASEQTKIFASITRRDIMAMSIITVIYACVALYNLGDFKAPQTYLKLEKDNPVTAELNEQTEISELMVYLGPSELSEDRSLYITLSDENGNVTYKTTLENGSVFFWNTVSDIAAEGKNITVSASDDVYIFEMALYDSSHRLVSFDTQNMLFDEQNAVPYQENFRNSTYFDEIYHARTAYEFVHGLPVYEWTHPPLGKVFISLGIQLFGMKPFGWRIVGTLFGILMIPVIYIFAKKIFGLTWVCVCAALLFTFDFMHFAQTRIATIDVYVTFFIMLMYLFMYKYYNMSFNDVPLKKTFVPLGLAGISMGLAIACKWTGVYAGAGLAVIFFISLYRRCRENMPDFKAKALKTVLFCILMFIAVPVLIYTVSYIPFIRCEDTGFKGIIDNQLDMFTYHGKTVVDATHYFSSPWYEWPINFRPIWYYSGENGIYSENISSFGNPLVWWSGIAAFVYCLYDAVRHKNKDALFLVIAYLAQLIPWIPVTRITFIYHYFPCVPFVVLMISHSAYRLYTKNIRYKKYFMVFTALAVVLFIAFYPVISGFPVDGEYVKNFLRWLPSWHLIG